MRKAETVTFNAFVDFKREFDRIGRALESLKVVLILLQQFLVHQNRLLFGSNVSGLQIVLEFVAHIVTTSL